jgi:two-component system, NtrC family, sensor kinase
MNITTRLILLLTLSVSLMMAVASYFMLRQRAVELSDAARDEVRAHAITLQIALEEDYATGRALDAQRLIDRLQGNAKIYGVFLFDREGRVTIASNVSAPEEIRYAGEARRAIATGETIEVTRSLNREEVFSIIMPIHRGAERVSALEIAQPISFVKADISHARRDTALMAALLCVTIFLVVLVVTYYSLSLPVRELTRGALAVGKGDLNYRVHVPRSGGEFTILAREFNRMADSLLEQRRASEREAEERLDLERKLRHSERLAVVGRLAAGVAHEIGAPLQVIDGRAKQLLNNPEAPVETRQRNLTLIRTQAERIARIVRQLLNLARPYNLRLSDVDLPALLAETLELLETSAAQSDIRLALEPCGGLTVKADAGLLHQVFMNICLNAVQTVSTRRQAGGRVRVEFVPEAGVKDGREFAAVRVVDNGGGIAAEHFPPLFDPFFTTREPGKGTGLGLPVSRRIVEEHGGWIEAANNDEGGATFTVFLPKELSPQPAAGRLAEARL